MAATNRQAYLRQLKWWLLLRYEGGEVNSILEDYAGFFEAGAATGKSEAEICTELGAPRAVAAMLLREDAAGLRCRPFLSKMALPILCLALCVSLLWKPLLRRWLLFDPLLLWLPITVALLRLALRGVSGTAADQPRSAVKGLPMTHLACGGLSLALWLAFLKWMPVWLTRPPFGLAPHQLGPLTTGLLILIAAVAAALLLLGLWRAKTQGHIWFTVVCHALGVLGVALRLNDLLHSLDNISIYFIAALACWAVYLEALALSGVFWLLARQKGGRLQWTRS